MKPLLALFAAACLSLAAMSSDAAATVRIDFSNPNLSPSSWTLVLHPDGSGHFSTRPGAQSQTDLDAPAIDRSVQLNSAFVQQVFRAASSSTVLRDDCESHAKVAFEGWKTISYIDGDTHGSCKFNYSKNKQIQSISEALVGVATTLVEGERLEMLLEHDPLGLDKEMEFLVEASGDGRIRQVCAIRGILQRLAANQSVMERVRKRARILLDKAEKGE